MTVSMKASIAASNLWNQAFTFLDSDLRDSLKLTRTHWRDILEAVLKEIEAKRDLAIRKRWKLKKPDGEVVIVRDVLEKTATWISRFKETGDVITQDLPVQLSLPWTAFRYLLRMTISEVQMSGALYSHLEIIARIVTRYRKFEQIHLKETKFELGLMLREGLTRLYIEILTYLACAIRLSGESSIAGSVKTSIQAVDEEQMHKVLAQETKVFKIIKVTDADKLLNSETTVTRLSAQATLYYQSLSEQKYNKIIDWLGASPHHTYHQFISQSRLPGLGEWLLDHKDYLDWQTSSSSSILLLHGITGSGKSMLCSGIVDSLQSLAHSNPLVAPFGYIYCADFDSRNTNYSSDNIMRFILSQLALDRTGQRKIKDFLCSEYERQNARAKVNALELRKSRTQDCVWLILELAEQEPLTIIIDAIDALKESERHTLVSALKRIVSEADNVVKILITSRSSDYAIISAAANKEIQITHRQTQKDMEAFVNHLVDTAVAKKLLLKGNVSTDLRSILIKALLDRAEETFLWTRLQIERLCRSKTEDDIIVALQSGLLENLDQLHMYTYTHVYGEPSSHTSSTMLIARDTVTNVFFWLLHQRESLTPSALVQAISMHQKSEIQITQLISLCTDSIVLDKDCNVVRFAHRSVKEFLERNQLFTGAEAHNILASTCIEACSRSPVSTGSSKMPSDDFCVYAALYWPVHLKEAETITVNEDVVDKTTSFIFDKDFEITSSFKSWLGSVRELVTELGDDHVLKTALDEIPEGDAGLLFTISVFGLNSLLRVAFQHIVDLNVNQKNKHGHTPVYLAAAFAHSTTVSLLADHGADVNVKCGKYGSPLHAACFLGHLEVVDILLNLDANASSGLIFDNSLQAACRGGSGDVALHLIESGYVIKSEDDYKHALEDAALAGFIDVIEQLRRPSFSNLDKLTTEGTTRRIRKALQGGHLGALSQFLGQQTDKKEALPPDAVALATLYNHKTLVEYLLDEGMSLEAEGPLGTPLRTACLLNQQSVTRLLLHRGAEINACGTFGDALQAAAMKGHTAIMQLLIDEGASVNQFSGFYGLALQAAAYHGQHGAVELLLDAGASAHAVGYSHDAFHAACEAGHRRVILLMLRKGYKYSRPPPLPTMPCFSAGPSPYKALMRDASPGRDSHPDRQRWTSPPLSIRTFCTAIRPTVEFEAIFRVATEDGTETAQTSSGKAVVTKYERRLYSVYEGNCAVKVTASAGHEETVRLLLEQREILGITDYEISEGIKVAAANTHLSIVQLLLDNLETRQSIKHDVEQILEIGRRNKQPQLIELALNRAAQHCSAAEIAGLEQRLVTAADKYHNDSQVSQETLVSDFARSCRDGNIEVIDAILKSKHHAALSPSEIDAGLQLCALKGQSAIAQMLLDPPSLEGIRPHLGEEAFVAAAASGSLNIMRLLTSCWTGELTAAGNVAVIRALAVASGNGHIDVVRHLVREMSVDVNSLAPEKPVGPGLNKSPWVSHPSARNLLEPSPGEPAVLPVISSLQAALRDFASSASPRHDPTWSNEPRKAQQPQYEEVIMFLLESGSKPDDLGGQTAYPIQLAVKFCPEHLVDKFLSMDVDVNATQNGESVLFVAAGRELSTAAVVRKLFALGTNLPRDVEEQKALLDEPLRYFEGNTSRKNFLSKHEDPDGRFRVAPSLEYVFKQGPGAVLFDLLQRMPQISTIDVRWSLVLQMTAILDDHLFVDMLLSRGTDVNATGYYYGTALQAAARLGHVSMVQKLLDAGAQVNVLEGRWQTAVRAALVGGHADVVDMLLEHGADMELRPTGQLLYTDDSKKGFESALQLGVRSGDLSIVQNLLRRGANATLDESETLHALILASAQGSVAIAKELLNAGAPVDVHGKKRTERREILKILTEDASPIHAAVVGHNLDVIRLLLSRGADVENSFDGICTPLGVAVSLGQADIVRLLLAAGANAMDSTALSDAIKVGNVDIAQELLAAGSRAELVLALACSQGLLPMIELLLEKIYDGENPDAAIDEAFAVHGLRDSILQLLLAYAPPTIGRFVQVCAAGSVASAEIMLDSSSIDINEQDEASGDYPLQVAASYLQAEMVEFLLARGANTACKSAKHGTPLMTALEGCAASAMRKLMPENAEELAEALALPSPEKMASNRSRQLSNCEKIVQLLMDHGAGLREDDRPFGPPLYLACLMGSTVLVELFLEEGADPDETDSVFEKPIFAAILSGRSDIVALLLQKAPLTRHVHSDWSTPLHLACTVGDCACVRILLEHGADATVLDENGRTPLTKALEEHRANRTGRAQIETPFEIILKLAQPVLVLENDIVAAAKINGEDVLTALLGRAEGMVVSEAAICDILKCGYASNRIIELLMQRSGGIGVTARMLETGPFHNLDTLLKHNPICRITPNILRSQRTLMCVRRLLEVDPAMPITEEVILIALEFLYGGNDQARRDVLETLFERSPGMATTEEMLRSVRCPADAEILLRRLEPGTHISAAVLAAVRERGVINAHLTMRTLFEFDPEIRLEPETALKMVEGSYGLDALDILLQHDPSMGMPMSEEMFLQVFPAWGSDKGKLANVLHKHGARVVFTDGVRERIDRAFQNKSEMATRERFYALRADDGDMP